MDRAFDRVLIARHFALSAGAITAYVFRAELRIGYMALSIVGISAILNFLAYVGRKRPRLARLCYFASPVIGIGGWTALVMSTSGVASPFMAGLWLEIMFSAMALQPQMIVWVTVGSVGALWAQQTWLGIGYYMKTLLLQSGFLLGMGAATYLVTRRWLIRQTSSVEERDRLASRLDDLERQLADERIVAALGENVARLAHGLKNAVHSLRGFVRLIETRFDEKSEGRAALDGLRAAIDDLESLAHLTLGSDRPATAPAGWPAEAAGTGRLLPVVDRALREVRNSHPGVDWETRHDGARPVLSLPETSFAETLVILMRNAVESMEGQGRATVETWVDEDGLHVRIVDEGRGFGDVEPNELFKPGFTTKPGGSGYGLFLARRIVEEHGGTIEARPGDEHGAVVEVVLPIQEPERARSAGSAG